MRAEEMMVEARANENLISFLGVTPTTRPGHLAHASLLFSAHEQTRARITAVFVL